MLSTQEQFMFCLSSDLGQLHLDLRPLQTYSVEATLCASYHKPAHAGIDMVEIACTYCLPLSCNARCDWPVSDVSPKALPSIYVKE